MHRGGTVGLNWTELDSTSEGVIRTLPNSTAGAECDKCDSTLAHTGPQEIRLSCETNETPQWGRVSHVQFGSISSGLCGKFRHHLRHTPCLICHPFLPFWNVHRRPILRYHQLHAMENDWNGRKHRRSVTAFTLGNPLRMTRGRRSPSILRSTR